MSPFRAEETKDPKYVREMWQQYSKEAKYTKETNDNEVRRRPEEVHAYLKKMEEGPDSEDAQTLSEVASGAINKDDQKMQNYLIRQYQKKRY